MDVKAKSPSAPECIEIIDSDEDCELVDPSQDVLKEGEKVINKFYRSTSIQDLDAHFEDYVSAIKKGLASFKANTQRFLLVGLYKQIDQIYSIYTYNKEKYTLIGSYYYWIMEDLLVLYCNIEFEVYANRLKLDATIPPNDVVIRICNILYKALDCNFKHIINAVLRLDERYFSMNFSRIVNALLKRVIIAEYHMSPRTMEADEFCRISLIMELWKKVRKPEQHMAMDYSVFIISKWTQEQLENHDKLMYILKEDIDQDPSRQFSILQVRIQRYFQIYGERVDESMEMSDENDCLNINDMYIYSRTKMCDEIYLELLVGTGNLELLEPVADEPSTSSTVDSSEAQTEQEPQPSTSGTQAGPSTKWFEKVTNKSSEFDSNGTTETNSVSSPSKPSNVNPVSDNSATPEISFRTIDLNSCKCIHTRQKRKNQSKPCKFGKMNYDTENSEDIGALIDKLYASWQRMQGNSTCFTNQKEVLAEESATAECSTDSSENFDMEFFFRDVPHQESRMCNDQNTPSPPDTVTKTVNDTNIIEVSVTKDSKLPTPLCYYDTNNKDDHSTGDAPDSPNSMLIVCDEDLSHLEKEEMELEQGKTNSAAFKEFLKILEPNIDNPVEEQSSPLVEPPITSDVEPITSTSDGELMCLEENSQSESDLNLNNCASLTDNDSEHKQVIEMAYDQSKTTETTETTETESKTLIIFPHQYLQATVEEQIIYVREYKILCQAPRLRSAKKIKRSNTSNNVVNSSNIEATTKPLDLSPEPYEKRVRFNNTVTVNVYKRNVRHRRHTTRTYQYKISEE